MKNQFTSRRAFPYTIKAGQTGNASQTGLDLHLRMRAYLVVMAMTFSAFFVVPMPATMASGANLTGTVAAFSGLPQETSTGSEKTATQTAPSANDASASANNSAGGEGASGESVAQTGDTSAEVKPDAAAAKAPAEPLEPTDGVLPINRAWEYSHYRVRVWLSSDGSPEVNGALERLSREIVGSAELVDRSGWELLVNPAPNPWNWRFSKDLSDVASLKGFEAEPQLKFDDKLMIVVLRRSDYGVLCRVREFDLWAQQWGSLIEREVVNLDDLGNQVFEMIVTAFMPVAQIDNANEKNEVAMRTKAVLSCKRSRFDESGEWVAEPNSGSPVFIREKDVFLPVLRRTDRDNKLISLDPVAYTFITLDEINGARLTGHVQSTVRAPLSARKSKRLQKIALVIRPPESNTVLKLISADEEKQNMEGIEVYSRRPNAEKDEESELIGKTDWRGLISIPPSPDGMRMIYLKRGNRAMRKLPIVPGFIPYQEADITNDEARLFAEGVIQGIQIELLDLVTQRSVYETDINEALDANDATRAREVLGLYQQLPTPQEFRARLSDEKSRLLTRAKDQREFDFIDAMFQTLQVILSKNIGESKVTGLRERIQQTTPDFTADQTGS